MAKSAPAIAILSGGLLLAGCQTAGNNLRQLNNGIRVPEAAAGQLRAEQQLAAGRAALQQRNFATAIVALREAAIDPALAPASLNGLGVAYAGIGRNDLAEQYFRRAISADPANPRYEENLARLYRAQLAVAQARRDKERAREEALAARQQANRVRQLAAGIQVAAPKQQMVVVSRGEVQLRTVRDQLPVAARALVAAPAPAARLAVSTAVPGALVPAGPLPVESPAAVPVVVVAQRAPAVSATGLRATAPVTVIEPPRTAIVVEGRREIVLPKQAEQAAPAVLAVSSTGRLYAPGSGSGISVGHPATTSGSSVQLAVGKDIGATIMKPMMARQSTLGPLDSDLTVNSLPLGVE
jgi:hypothetical protein